MLCYLFQLSAQPQTRVTFGGTQLRSCSVSSESSRSSTSGSSCSRRYGVYPTDRPAETRQSRSCTEIEDYQRMCYSKNPRSNMDPDMVGRYKKAKIDQEASVRDESPFVHLARTQNQSFASLEQSLTETGADDCHFWSSPQHEDSYVRLEEEDIESPLRHIDEDQSSCFRSSFLNTCDKPTSSCQANFTTDVHGRGSDRDYFRCPGDVRDETDVSLFAKGTPYKPASNLQSSTDHQQLTTDTHTVTVDAKSQRSEAGNKAASIATASSKKWWAFVNGITSELSLPGWMLLISFFWISYFYNFKKQMDTYRQLKYKLAADTKLHKQILYKTTLIASMSHVSCHTEQYRSFIKYLLLRPM